MRNMLALVGALVVATLAIGYYLNWFQVRTTPGTDGTRNVSIDIDTKKVDQDVKSTEKKVEKFIDDESKKAKANPPSNDPPAPPFNPAVQAKDSINDPKFQLNLYGPSGRQ